MFSLEIIVPQEIAAVERWYTHSVVVVVIFCGSYHAVQCRFFCEAGNAYQGGKGDGANEVKIKPVFGDANVERGFKECTTSPVTLINLFWNGPVNIKSKLLIKSIICESNLRVPSLVMVLVGKLLIRY